MSTRSYVKQLRLVTPWTARRLGIRAEAPVFISPWVHEQARCSGCNRLYSPLVYQTGYETAAQHQCGPGGIYCHDLSHAQCRQRATRCGRGCRGGACLQQAPR
jgi:hypothetical protein